MAESNGDNKGLTLENESTTICNPSDLNRPFDDNTISPSNDQESTVLKTKENISLD